MNTHPPGRPAARPPRVPPVRAFTQEERARIAAALEALVARIREAITRMTLALRAAAQAMTEAFARIRESDWGLVALEVRRTAPTRPAWATPYGPPPRRHRS